VIAATRVLRIATDGEHVEVPVSIHVPFDDDGAWRCDFEIGWPETPTKFRGMGLDSVQALESARKMIAVHLYASPYHHAGTLYFDQPGNGYGFPLPAGSRDLAVGDDRKL
jgi:hypothetical protein